MQARDRQVKGTQSRAGMLVPYRAALAGGDQGRASEAGAITSRGVSTTPGSQGGGGERKGTRSSRGAGKEPGEKEEPGEKDGTKSPVENQGRGPEPHRRDRKGGAKGGGSRDGTRRESESEAREREASIAGGDRGNCSQDVVIHGHSS